MKRAIVTAIVALVFGLAAFNFARVSSDERDSAEPVGLANGRGQADSALPLREGQDLAAAPELEGGHVRDETRVPADFEAGTTARATAVWRSRGGRPRC